MSTYILYRILHTVVQAYNFCTYIYSHMTLVIPLKNFLLMGSATKLEYQIILETYCFKTRSGLCK